MSKLLEAVNVVITTRDPAAEGIRLGNPETFSWSDAQALAKVKNSFSSTTSYKTLINAVSQAENPEETFSLVQKTLSATSNNVYWAKIKNSAGYEQKELSPTLFLVTTPLGGKFIVVSTEYERNQGNDIAGIFYCKSSITRTFQDQLRNAAKKQPTTEPTDESKKQKFMSAVKNQKPANNVAKGQKQEQSQITKEQFMDFFRNSDEFNEEMTVEECIELFLGCLKGQDDITRDLLDKLCSNYDLDLDEVVANTKQEAGAKGMFYIGRRDNPQSSKPYYKAYGQLSKTTAKEKGKPAYGSMTLTSYEDEAKYKSAIEKLKADGFRVLD